MSAARCCFDELDESTIWDVARMVDRVSVLSFAAAYDRVGRAFGRVDPVGLPILRGPFGAYDANLELEHACFRGSKLLARFLVDHGADGFYLGLQGACRGGHIGLAKVMIRLGGIVDLERAASHAAQSGCIDLLEFVLANGASNRNRILIGATEGGHMEIAECAIRNGANNWEDAMNTACDYGNRAMIELCEAHGTKVNARPVTGVTRADRANLSST